MTLSEGGGGTYTGDCKSDNSCGDGIQGTHNGCGDPGYIGPCAPPPSGGSNHSSGTASSGSGGSGGGGCFGSWGGFWGCTKHVAADVGHAAVTAAPYVGGALIVIGGVVCVAATDGACAVVALGSLTTAEGATVAAGACLTSVCGALALGGGIVFGAPGDDGLIVGGGSGANMAAEDEVFGTAVQQTKPMSCFAACGEMLTNGAVSQGSLIAKLDPTGTVGATSGDTARGLGGGWRGGSVADVGNRDQVFAALNTTGSWGAMMRGAKGGYHMVVVDGLDLERNVLVRDPHNGSSYTTPYNQFINAWTDEAVFNP